MTTPSEEEARAAAEKYLDDLSLGAYLAWPEHQVEDGIRDFVAGANWAASRVSTPPSEEGSCWDEGPTLPVREGECGPMPPMCQLQAGHLGAHRGPRNQHGLATEWRTRDPYNQMKDRAERAERVIEKVRTYADDRAFHARGHLNTVNSGRIASDLYQILGHVPAVPVLPTEPECWCSDIAQSYGLTDPGCPRHDPAPSDPKEEQK